ncbi:MAG: IS5 family transposase, partial [Pseudomonadota bacterium]
EQVLESWYDDSPLQRGGQYVYSDLCIETMMMLKTLYKLGYRQTAGFVSSLFELLGWPEVWVPSYTQLNRRAHELQIAAYEIPAVCGPLHIAVDSTGVKVYGEGEWKVRKHGWSKRRTWRKLHLGVDPDTHYIHAHTLTENSADDASQVEDLLDQIDEDIDEFSADGAYDKRKCWDPLQHRNIKGIIPPQVNANYWYDENGELLDHRRNKVLKQIDKRGRKKWKKRSGYHRRSIAETAMMRFKTIHGPTLYSRKPQAQQTEVNIKIKLLNIMTAQGMPVCKKVKRKEMSSSPKSQPV